MVDLVKASDRIYADVYHAPIVLEGHRLIFFDVYKNACTSFKMLFYQMTGNGQFRPRLDLSLSAPAAGAKAKAKGKADGGSDIPGDHRHRQRWGLLHAPRRNKLRYLSDYNLTQANRILQDPGWTRAIFVRDPHERFLSAYLFLTKPENAHLIRKACCDTISFRQGAGQSNYTSFCRRTRSPLGNNNDHGSSLKFKEFVDMIPHCRYEDKHWEPQSKRMDAKYWPYVNFVGRVETLQQDAKALLVRVGAWEAYGKFVGGGEAMLSTTRAAAANATVADKNDISRSVFGSSGGMHHATGASERIEEFYSGRRLYEQVRNYYQRDFDHPLFGFDTVAAPKQ